MNRASALSISPNNKNTHIHIHTQTDTHSVTHTDTHIHTHIYIGKRSLLPDVAGRVVDVAFVTLSRVASDVMYQAGSPAERSMSTRQFWHGRSVQPDYCLRMSDNNVARQACPGHERVPGQVFS